MICADALDFLERARTAGRQFDIVFADPPYVRREEDEALVAVAALLRDGILAEGGMLVLEQAKDAHFSVPEGWQLTRERKYGKSVIRILALI